MQKKTFAIRALVFLLLLGVLSGAAGYILTDRSAYGRQKAFYELPRDSLDVLFVGSSRIMCGVYPLQLWQEQGIPSFDCAGSAQVLAQSYFQLKDALNYQSPSLVVLDVSTVANGNVYTGEESFVHTQLDHMRSPLVRLEAICTLTEPKDWAEYLFPIIKYHGRWSEFDPGELRVETDIGRGARVYVGQTTAEVITEPALIPAEVKEEIEPIPLEFLHRIARLCRERGAELLFLVLPVVRDAQAQALYNAVADVAEQCGADYLNLMHLPGLGFDYRTELFDTAHCNSKGAERVTVYLGTYIRENYDLPDRRGESAYAHWDADAQEWIASLS